MNASRRVFGGLLLVLLSSLLVSRTWGQAIPSGPPSWTRTLPVGELYYYFRGDAVDPNLERAKLKARTDAYRKAQVRFSTGTTDVMVDRLKIETDLDSLSTESSVAFGSAQFAGMEWVADYSEIVPQSGVAVYHYYVLLRIPKQKAGVAARIGQGITGRADAVFHSAVFPGWGQIRQGRKGEGAFFAITTPIAALVTGLCYAGERDKQFTPDQQANWRTARRGAMYATLGLYGANLIDALVLGRKARDYRAVSFYPGGVVVRLGCRE